MFNRETPEQNINRKCSEIDCLTRLLAQFDRTKINNEIQIKVVAAGLSFDITCNGNKQNKQSLDIPPFMKKFYNPEGGGKLW